MSQEHELGSQPVEAAYRSKLNAIMKTLDGLFNGEGEKVTGIVLLLFPYGDRQGRANYISNGANRSDVCRLLEEQIQRFRSDRDDDGPILAKMADAITEVYERAGANLTRDVALTAASVAIQTYRKG